MLALLLALAAPAAPHDTPVTLSGGLVQATAPGAVGGGVHGRALVHLGRGWSAEAGAREVVLAGPDALVGAITLGGRWTSARGLHLRLAFLHHHETPLDVARVAPVSTVLGTASGIAHRSGLEAGVGLERPVWTEILDGRLGLVGDVAAGVIPDTRGPPVHVVIEVGLSVDVGRRASE